jgi:hypothetical protein
LFYLQSGGEQVVVSTGGVVVATGVEGVVGADVVFPWGVVEVIMEVVVELRVTHVGVTLVVVLVVKMEVLASSHISSLKMYIKYINKVSIS